MATFGIESNGRIDRTALYLNGEQISGVQEVYIHITEDGTFDSVIRYKGSDGVERSKSLFDTFLENISVRPPAFSEEDAKYLRTFVIDSDGSLENTVLFLNDEELDGVTEVFLHIKAPQQKKSGFLSRFSSGSSGVEEHSAVFRAEISYRYDDGSIETEQVFT